MAPRDEAALVKQFREELVKEDLLHDGDSIGTEDATLLQVFWAQTILGVLIPPADDSYVHDSLILEMRK